MSKRNYLFHRILYFYYNLLAFFTKGNKRFVDKKLLFGALIIGISQYACKPKSQDFHSDIKDKDSNHNGIIKCYEEVTFKNTDSSKNKKSIAVKTKSMKISTTTMCYGVVEEPTCYMTVTVHEPPENDSLTPYSFVDIQPEFPGGEDSLQIYLKSNIIYPEIAQKNNVEGTVYITFIVEFDGSITEPRILRGIGSGCDEEAIRLIKLMSKWIPGKNNGKTVRVRFNLPVYFKLQK